jgi:hypothetical protein
MDPNACLRELLDELASTGDRETIMERLAALETWIARGGFLPSVSKMRVHEDTPLETNAYTIDG